MKNMLAAIANQSVNMLLSTHSTITKRMGLAEYLGITENVLKNKLAGRSEFNWDDFISLDRAFFELDPDYTYKFWLRSIHCNQAITLDRRKEVE